MTTSPFRTAFRVHPLAPGVLDHVRAHGTDAFGGRAERLTAEGGDPLRCCLRNATAGESLLLFAHRPPLPDSPYRETGAVLAHADPCPGPARTDVYPADWRWRAQVLRAYDARGRIHDATTVHDGTDPEAVITRLFADPGVERLHSRNVAWGCYMFTITRA